MKRSLCIMLLAVLCLCAGCGAASEGNDAQLHSSATEAQTDSVEPEIIEADWNSDPTESTTKAALYPVPTTTLITAESVTRLKEMADEHLHSEDCRTHTASLELTVP